MNTPISELLTEGKILLAKVRRHYTQPPETLPPDQQVTVAEVEAWYKGVTTSLETAFGPFSYEVRTWKFRMDEARKQSWESVFDGKPPAGESFVVELLVESIGALAEIKFAGTRSKSLDNASLPFSALHPKIAERCKALFAENLYEDAVFAAFKAIEETVRQRSGFDATDVGVNLISKAMNPKSPVLRFCTVDAEQEAMHSLFRGAIGAFKNPSSHRSVEYTDAPQVLELLAFASLLMRRLDESQTK